MSLWSSCPVWAPATYLWLEIENLSTTVIKDKLFDLLTQFFDIHHQDVTQSATTLWTQPNANALVHNGKSSLFKRMVFACLLRHSMDPSLFQEIQLKIDDVLHQDGSVLWYIACSTVF